MMNFTFFLKNAFFAFFLFLYSFFIISAVQATTIGTVGVVCPFNINDINGRIVVEFDARLRSDSSEFNARSNYVNTNIPAGNYKVSLASYDGYLGRASSYPQSNESWLVKFKNSSLESSAIGDLYDGDDYIYLNEVVDESLYIPQSMDYVKAFHAAYPDTSSANSVTAVCAAFDPVVQCSDGIDNDGDGNIDYPDDTGCTDATDDDENSAPIITLLGDDPMYIAVGSSFTEPGATASDTEDGDITEDIIIGGDTVDTSIIGGIYAITYNATDSEGLAAGQVIRVVSIIPTPVTYQCSDGIDNDGDGNIDYPDDTGCTDATDDDENSAPIITLIGSSTISFFVNTTFTDPEASATDVEDGTIPFSSFTVGTSTIDMTTVGSYQMTYDVSDSDGKSATQVQRTVNVTEVPVTYQCSDGIDNDGDGNIDYPDDTGCTDATDDDENSAPIITLIGSNMSLVQNSSFTDPQASASDAEDGDITANIVIGGSVDTSSVGSYILTYDVTDSNGASATQVTRTVNITSGGGGGGGGGGGTPNQCSDYKDNDGDGYIDMGDPGCESPNDNDETNVEKQNTPPSIKLIDSNIMVVLRGGIFIDPGALATDKEDGDITGNIIYTGFIDTNTLGSYAISYDVSDSKGAKTERVTRIVSIISGSGETCEPYLLEYLRIDFKNNNPNEVRKLQIFLRDFEGFSDLSVTGVFDQPTFDAVSAFQKKYNNDVLSPWGTNASTGYVYITTKKKINEIYCQSEFPLTDAQIAEINASKGNVSIQPTPQAPPASLEEPAVPVDTGDEEDVNPIIIGSNTGNAVNSAEENNSAEEISSILANAGNIELDEESFSQPEKIEKRKSFASVIFGAGKQILTSVGDIVLSIFR